MPKSPRSILLTLLAVFVAALAIVEATDPDGTPESWLLLTLFHPGPKYLDLSVELEIEGRPVTLQRSIECKPKFARSDMQSGLGYSIGWYPEQYLASRALDDGSGIMVVIPRGCSLAGPPPSEYSPLVLWADSVANPTLIEAYFDPAGLSHGRFRVTLKSFHMAIVDTPRLPRAGEFADIFNIYSKSPSPEGSLVQFVALGAFEVPVGSLPADKREYLQTLAASGAVTVSDREAILELDPRRARSYIPIVRAMSGEYEARTTDTIRKQVQTQTATLANLIAFAPSEGSIFHVVPATRGIAYFVRLPVSWCPKKGLRCIQWGNDQLSIDHFADHYLMRNGKLLYEFQMPLTFLLTP